MLFSDCLKTRQHLIQR